MRKKSQMILLLYETAFLFLSNIKELQGTEVVRPQRNSIKITY